MYDVLVYVFENCQQADLAFDRERVAKKLSAAGFEDSDISEALHWLAGVARAPQSAGKPIPESRAAFRAFAPRELAKLDAACRGFLLTLEQSGSSGSAARLPSGQSPELDDTGLLAYMGHDPVDVDSLCSLAGLSAEQVSRELLRLELDGRVTVLPGGLYQRLVTGMAGKR